MASISNPLDLEELTLLRARVAHLEAEVAKYAHCWHCHDELMEDPPHHCESCPEWGCCSEDDCTAPGCEEDVKAHHARIAKLDELLNPPD